MEWGENVEKLKKKKFLGKYCVVGGFGNVSCINNFKIEGILMYMFFCDDVICEKWVCFV